MTAHTADLSLQQLMSLLQSLPTRYREYAALARHVLSLYSLLPSALKMVRVCQFREEGTIGHRMCISSALFGGFGQIFSRRCRVESSKFQILMMLCRFDVELAVSLVQRGAAVGQVRGPPPAPSVPGIFRIVWGPL